MKTLGRWSSNRTVESWSSSVADPGGRSST